MAMAADTSVAAKVVAPAIGEPVRRRLTLRVPSAGLDAHKATGPGWQTCVKASGSLTSSDPSPPHVSAASAGPYAPCEGLSQPSQHIALRQVQALIVRI